jgi:hypothetical protein
MTNRNELGRRLLTALGVAVLLAACQGGAEGLPTKSTAAAIPQPVVRSTLVAQAPASCRESGAASARRRSPRPAPDRRGRAARDPSVQLERTVCPVP